MDHKEYKKLSVKLDTHDLPESVLAEMNLHVEQCPVCQRRLRNASGFFEEHAESIKEAMMYEAAESIGVPSFEDGWENILRRGKDH